MTELADIFRRYGPAYRAKYGDRMLPSHVRAMWDIEHCRTEALGGQVYWCDECEQANYSYHSCQNRHCPKCQHETAQQWLQKQQALLLPTPYFMVTFTLPEQLRPVARSNQKLIYNLLFRASAAALQALARDPRFVGGQIGLIGVLHTWARDLSYHPHVHYLVPAGGLSLDGQTWLRSSQKFLVPVKPLSILFRAKFRHELKKTDLFDQVPEETWTKTWVVHAKPVGRGEQALTYLARYIFRVAITNNRILQLENDQVTFRYQETQTGQNKLCPLPALTFIQRFLQHVLPKGLVKVRYYGFFSPGKRHLLNQIKHLLAHPGSTSLSAAQTPEPQPAPSQPDRQTLCPKCGQTMRLQQTLRPTGRCPP
jgi:hypothetical protein